MNLFELFVKIGVDDQASDKISSLSSKLGNGLKTAAKIGAAAVGAAAAGIAALTTEAVNSFAEYEQLAGGAQKIFDQMDYSKIAQDANNAYKELGLSANQYLAVINDVGATFSATMGDEAGYEAAKTGLKAISDYASGTGKNVDELSQKFTLITRSTSSYQSIADQFSGILPATSAGFLEQAQSAGILSDSYTQLTEVPIDEYQAAVSQMLQQGVTELGLANNTVLESENTISGSLAAMKASWSNLIAGVADENANLEVLVGNFVDSAVIAGEQLLPRVEAVLNGAGQVIDEVVPIIIEKIPEFIDKYLPKILESGVSIVLEIAIGLIKAIPSLVKSIPKIISSIVNAFKSKFGEFTNIGQNIVNAVGDGIKSLASDAIQWGKDLIQNFIDGIKAKWNALKQTITNTAQTIRDRIAFSEPKEGPLSDFHTYAPDMMDLFIKGIKDNEKKLTDQIEKTFDFGERTISAGISIGNYGNGGFSAGSGYGASQVSVVQNIYSEAKTAADLMQEALYQQERAVLLGV